MGRTRCDVAPDDDRLQYGGYVRLSVDQRRARFDRPSDDLEEPSVVKHGLSGRGRAGDEVAEGAERGRARRRDRVKVLLLHDCHRQA